LFMKALFCMGSVHFSLGLIIYFDHVFLTIIVTSSI
jgi:hypothetical protein